MLNYIKEERNPNALYSMLPYSYVVICCILGPLLVTFEDCTSVHYRDPTTPYVCEYALRYASVFPLWGPMMPLLPCILKHFNSSITCYYIFSICCTLGPLREMYTFRAPAMYRDQTIHFVCEFVQGYGAFSPLLGSMMSHMPCFLECDTVFIFVSVIYVGTTHEHYESNNCRFLMHCKRLLSTAYVCFEIGASLFTLRWIYMIRLMCVYGGFSLTFNRSIMYSYTVCLGIRSKIFIIGDSSLVETYWDHGEYDSPAKLHDQVQPV